MPAVPLPTSDQPIQGQRSPQMPMPMQHELPPPPLPPRHSDQPNVLKRRTPISLLSSLPVCHSSNQLEQLQVLQRPWITQPLLQLV